MYMARCACVNEPCRIICTIYISPRREREEGRGVEGGYTDKGNGGLFVCTNVCACVYYCLAHVHAYTTDHTNHTTHTLRLLDSGVFLPGSIWSAESTANSQSSQISLAFCTLVSLSRISWSIIGFHWGVGTKGWGLRDVQTHSDVCVHM